MVRRSEGLKGAGVRFILDEYSKYKNCANTKTYLPLCEFFREEKSFSHMKGKHLGNKKNYSARNEWALSEYLMEK